MKPCEGIGLPPAFSQEKLAQWPAFTGITLGAVERGERNIALLNIVRIARALKLRTSNLLDGVDSPVVGVGERNTK